MSLRRRQRFGIGGYSRRSFDLMPPMELRYAIRSGDLSQVESILKQNPDFRQSKDRRNGATLLHGATFFNQLAIAKYLIDTGATVDAGDRRGSTALAWAASIGHKAILELLLSHGADAKAKDTGGFNALYCAASSGHLDIVKLLFSLGEDVDSRSKDGWTTLHTAAFRGHIHVVEWLVENGADVNAANSWGQTPLIWAAAPIREPAAETPPNTSFNRPDEVEAATKEASTLQKKMEVVKFLLARGANIDANDELGETPLYCAAYGGELEVAKLLLTGGAAVNAKTKDGWTALCVAAKRGHADVVKLLLRSGADAAIKVKDMYTPLNYAVLNGHKEITELLLSTAPTGEMPVKARCPGCGSKQQVLMNTPFFDSDDNSRKILRCPTCGAIWSQKKLKWGASTYGIMAMILGYFYSVAALERRHGIDTLHITLAIFWIWIGVSAFTKNSEPLHIWIKGSSLAPATK